MFKELIFWGIFDTFTLLKDDSTEYQILPFQKQAFSNRESMISMSYHITFKLQT